MHESKVLGSERVEFESDGELDSLTGVSAPARFLRTLQSEISAATREGRVMTIMTISLLGSRNASQMEVAESEAALVNLARSLGLVMRGGDHCARITEDGFWILTRGDRTAATFAAARFLADHEVEAWRVIYCQVEPGEQVIELLRRVDIEHFG